MTERLKAAPSAPTKCRSTQAVKSPADIPIAKNGRSGSASLCQTNWCRLHHRTMRIATGKTQIALFESNPSKNKPSATRNVDRFLVRSNFKYNNAEERQNVAESVFLSSDIQATDSTWIGCNAKRAPASHGPGSFNSLTTLTSNRAAPPCRRILTKW